MLTTFKYIEPPVRIQLRYQQNSTSLVKNQGGQSLCYLVERAWDYLLIASSFESTSSTRPYSTHALAVI